MYKLIFLILTLSGFLIYKAIKIKVVVKPASVAIADSIASTGSAKPVSQKAETKTVPKNIVQKSPNSEDVPVPSAAEESSQREQFDSLRDIYENDEGIEESKLTQHERETYENTLNQIRAIEAEDAARKNFRKGVTKSPEQLTPEELKLFDVYKKKEDDHE